MRPVRILFPKGTAMHYYRSSSDEGSSSLKFGLVVFSVAVIVVRAAQMMGVDFAATIAALTNSFH